MNKKEWAASVNERLEFTSDAPFLDNKRHRLFVCDDLMRGCENKFPEDKDHKFCAISFTTPSFTFWQGNGKNIPLEDLQYQEAPLAQIRGELYDVHADVLKELDLKKQNGVYFERKRVKIITPMRLKTKVWDRYDYVCKAWMYVGRSEYWRDEIDAGYNYQRVNLYKPKNSVCAASFHDTHGLYYCYRRLNEQSS